MEFYVLEALYLRGAPVVADQRTRNCYAAQVADLACMAGTVPLCSGWSSRVAGLRHRAAGG